MIRKTSRKSKLGEKCRKLAEFFHARSPAGWKSGFEFTRLSRLRAGGSWWDLQFIISAGEKYDAELESRISVSEWKGTSRHVTVGRKSGQVTEVRGAINRTLRSLGYEGSIASRPIGSVLRVGEFHKRLPSVTAVGREIEALESLRFGEGILIETPPSNLEPPADLTVEYRVG